MATEADIVAAFIANRHKAFPEVYFPVRELDGKCGIADIVLFEFDRERLRSRFNAGLTEPLTDYELKLLLAIRDGAYSTADELLVAFRLSLPQLRAGLSKLLKHGYVCAKDGQLKVSPHYQITSRHIVAIEAKLSHWQRALEQARSYMRFANTCYVAMPEHYVHRALRHRERFEECGVGLTSVATDGTPAIVIPARFGEPTSRQAHLQVCEVALRELLYQK